MCLGIISHESVAISAKKKVKVIRCHRRLHSNRTCNSRIGGNKRPLALFTVYVHGVVKNQFKLYAVVKHPKSSSVNRCFTATIFGDESLKSTNADQGTVFFESSKSCDIRPGLTGTLVRRYIAFLFLWRYVLRKLFGVSFRVLIQNLDSPNGFPRTYVNPATPGQFSIIVWHRDKLQCPEELDISEMSICFFCAKKLNVFLFLP